MNCHDRLEWADLMDWASETIRRPEIRDLWSHERPLITFSPARDVAWNWGRSGRGWHFVCSKRQTRRNPRFRSLRRDPARLVKWAGFQRLDASMRRSPRPPLRRRRRS